MDIKLALSLFEMMTNFWVKKLKYSFKKNIQRIINPLNYFSFTKLGNLPSTCNNFATLGPIS